MMMSQPNYFKVKIVVVVVVIVVVVVTLLFTLYSVVSNECCSEAYGGCC